MGATSEQTNSFLLQQLKGDGAEEHLGLVAWAVFNRLSKKQDRPPLLQQALTIILENNNQHFREVLFKAAAPFHEVFSEEEIDQILELMVGELVSNPDLISTIDGVLYKLCPNENRERLYSSLVKILEKGISIRKLSSTQHKIASSPPTPTVLGWYIIKLLLSDSHYQAKAAPELLPACGRDIFQFDVDEHGLSDTEIFYLVRKVFGYLTLPLTNGGAVSILARCIFALEGEQQKELEHFIFSFWLMNYPSDMEIFETIETQTAKEKASIRRLRKVFNSYYDDLDALPPNSAFKPSPAQRQAQAGLWRSEHKKIHKIADKESILAKVFTKHIILYGGGTVNYIHTKHGEKPERLETAFVKHDWSFYAPRSEKLFPVKLENQIRNFWMEKRPSGVTS